LRRLQDKLGAHQDAYSARNRLAALAADPANGLPAVTLFLMGRLAEHHAGTTAEAGQDPHPDPWRKVRGKRWRALRTRLEELSDTACKQTAARPISPHARTRQPSPPPACSLRRSRKRT